MELPIELFTIGIGLPIALALLGLARSPQIPALVSFAGIFILFLSITTDTIIMDYFTTDDSLLEYAYRVESRSFERSIVNNTAVIIAESVDGSSGQLMGDTVNCMDVMIRKTGSPNIAQPIVFGVYDTNGILKHTFGTFNVTAITTSATFYKACDYDNIYTFIANDRVGVEHTGSSASNQIILELDANNPFDGTVTTHQEYNRGTNTWTSFTANDLTMRLYFETIDSVTSTPVEFQFTEMPKTFFALLGSIFMLSGAIMLFKEDK